MTTLSFDNVVSFEVHDTEQLLNKRYRRVVEFKDDRGHVLRVNLQADSLLRLTAIFDADNDRPGDSDVA